MTSCSKKCICQENLCWEKCSKSWLYEILNSRMVVKNHKIKGKSWHITLATLSPGRPLHINCLVWMLQSHYFKCSGAHLCYLSILNASFLLSLSTIQCKCPLWNSVFLFGWKGYLYNGMSCLFVEGYTPFLLNGSILCCLSELLHGLCCLLVCFVWYMN